MQYVVQTSTKKSGWGWESYYKTQTDAITAYFEAKKDKSFDTVRIYYQGYVNGKFIIQSVNVKGI